MARKSKPIVFTDREQHLLEWGESQDKPFGTYVKDLIRDDMKRRANDIPKEEPKPIESNGTLGSKAKKSYRDIIGG